MPLTVKQSCDKLNISKMTLYKYLHQMFIKNRHLATMTYINNKHKRVLTDDLFKQLKKVVNGKHQRSKPKVYVSKIIDLQRENIELKRRLDHDNHTAQQSITDKRNEIEHLNKLLDHQQQLQLSSQKELSAVRKELNDTKNQFLTYKDKHHHGAIWRFFHPKH